MKTDIQIYIGEYDYPITPSREREWFATEWKEGTMLVRGRMKHNGKKVFELGEI